MVTRVSGGIITDQMLAGSLRYFEFAKTGIGADAIGDGNQRVTAAYVVAGGSGYTFDDNLTVTGGTGTSAVLDVRTVDSAGAVTSVSVTTAGDYSVLATNPVSVTGGTGTNATFDLEYTSLIQIPNYTTGVGSNPFFIGVNAPVPGSAADQVCEVIARKANIVQIALMDDNTFQVAVENTTWGWTTVDGSGPDGDTDLLDAINALGAAVVVPDATSDGGTIDLSTGVTITERFFSNGVSA